MSSSRKTPRCRKRDRFLDCLRSLTRRRDACSKDIQANPVSHLALEIIDDERPPKLVGSHPQIELRPRSSLPSSLREPYTSPNTGGTSPSTSARSEVDSMPSFSSNKCYEVAVQQLGQPERRGPVINVEDHSNHHHGNSYYTTHINHGPATFVGAVATASFGGGSSVTGPGRDRATGVPSHQPGVEALLWDSLPKQRDVSSVELDSYLEGSREGIIQAILSWMKDSNSELGMFIYGPAGLGKSTLARQLTLRLRETGRLAASVSLSGVPADARGPESVVKLISREIGEKYRSAIPVILEAIALCKGGTLEEHLKGYLSDPVCSLGLPHPLGVILDATDEWESHLNFIKALPYLSSGSSSLKFILLGRIGPQEGGFEDRSILPYPLQPVSNATMECYFHHHFNDHSIQWDSGRPSPDQVTQLAELADGLFIWAAIACSLLRKKLSFFTPNQTLASILSSGQLGQNGRLARLYHQAIMWLFAEPDEQSLVRIFLQTTLALQEPLPIEDFSSLSNLHAPAVRAIQSALTALQIRRHDDHLVHPASTLFHMSLVDYLKTPPVSPAHSFHVSLFGGHSQLAESCLGKLHQLPRHSQNIDWVSLSPQKKYVVLHLATHIRYGTPSAKPGSGDTRHHKTIRGIDIVQWKTWGSLLLHSTNASPTLMHEGGYAESEAGKLMYDIAETLKGGDAVVRSLRISCLEVAVRFEPEDAGMWDGLGWAYWEAAEHSKDIVSGERAVLSHQNVLDIGAAPGGFDMGHALFSLGTSLQTRFGLVGNAEDLDRSICLHRAALAQRPPGHEHRARSLNNLAISLQSYWEKTRSTGDLNEVIDLQREALQLCQPRGTLRTSALWNLGTFLQYRSQGTPSSDDLDESVVLCQEALDLFPPSHADRRIALTHLATSLDARFRVTASIDDLSKHVLICQEILELSPPGDAGRPSALRRLATSLHSRYEKLSSISDLEKDIALLQEAVKLCPTGDATRGVSLNNLAWSYIVRYEAMGERPDLETSILLGQESRDLLRDGHPERFLALGTLARALHHKAEFLEEAVNMSREAVELVPSDNPRRWEPMMNLAIILHRYYQYSGALKGLEEALLTCKETLKLCPPNHSRVPKILALHAKLVEAQSSSPVRFLESPPCPSYQSGDVVDR